MNDALSLRYREAEVEIREIGCELLRLGKVPCPVLQALRRLCGALRDGQISMPDLDPIEQHIAVCQDHALKWSAEFCAYEADFLKGFRKLRQGIQRPLLDCARCGTRCVDGTVLGFAELLSQLGQRALSLRRVRFVLGRLSQVLELVHALSSSSNVAVAHAPDPLLDSALARLEQVKEAISAAMLTFLHHTPCRTLPSRSLNLLLKFDDPDARDLAARVLGSASNPGSHPHKLHQETLELLALNPYPLRFGELRHVTRWPYTSPGAAPKRLHAAIEHLLGHGLGTQPWAPGGSA